MYYVAEISAFTVLFLKSENERLLFCFPLTAKRGIGFCSEAMCFHLLFYSSRKAIWIDVFKMAPNRGFLLSSVW